MSGGIRVRRVADPAPVQRGPAPFPSYEELTSAWDNHAEAKNALRRTEARLQEAELFGNSALNPTSPEPRGALSPGRRLRPAGMEDLSRVRVPVDRVPFVEITGSRHLARTSKQFSRFNYGSDKTRKRVTIVGNLDADQGSARLLPPPRNARENRLSGGVNLDALSPSRSVDNAQIQRLEDRLKSLSQTLKSSSFDGDRSHVRGDSRGDPTLDRDWGSGPSHAESYDQRAALKLSARSPSSQEILSRGSANLSVDNSTAVRILNDLPPRRHLESAGNQPQRSYGYREEYVPAYERLYGGAPRPGEPPSERAETFAEEAESEAREREALRQRLRESRKVVPGGSASDHMERLREKVEQQKAAVANNKQVVAERTWHRDSDPVILQDPSNEVDSLLAGFLPAKTTVRKIAPAPAAPAYKGFSEVETRFQMPDGKVVTEDHLTRKTSRRTREKSADRGRGKEVVPEDRALKPSRALQQQNRPEQSSRMNRTVRKVHKAPRVPDKRPKRPDHSKEVISTTAWREGQKMVLKILGPPPEKPKTEKTPALHSPPTHDTEDPPSSKLQDPAIPAAQRTKDDISDAELSEHTLENEELLEDKREASPAPDLDKLPSEAKNVLDDLHLDPSSEDERPPPKPKEPMTTAKATKKKLPKPAKQDPDPGLPAAERVRHYDTDNVRRYMAKQKAERRRKLLEEKKERKQAQERKQEQLRELSKKQKDSVRLSQRNRGAPTGSQLGETFSKGPPEEVITAQLSSLDRLPRSHPFHPDGKKMDVTSSDKENKNIWSTSSSDSSTQSSLPSDPPGSPSDQAPPAGGAGGVPDAIAATRGPPPRPVSPIGVVITQMAGGTPDRGPVLVGGDPGQRSQVTQPTILGQGLLGKAPLPVTSASAPTGISTAARSKADRIQALKATAAALQGKIDSEVKKLTEDHPTQAVPSPAGPDRWAHPAGARTAAPHRGVRFAGNAVESPERGNASPEVGRTRYQRLVGSDNPHVFTGSLPGTGNLLTQARLARDASDQENAATRIQAAFRGHSVRQRLDWNLPSGRTLGEAVGGRISDAVPEVHVSGIDQSIDDWTSPLRDRGASADLSLSEGSLSGSAAGDKDYMPTFKSLPVKHTHVHRPTPSISRASPVAVESPAVPARPISLPLHGTDKWKDSLADGLSVINIYTRKYQSPNRAILYGQLPTDSAQPVPGDSIIGYSYNDDFAASASASPKSPRSGPDDADPYSADFTAAGSSSSSSSSSKTKTKSKPKSTTSSSKPSSRARPSRSEVTGQTQSKRAEDSTLDLSPMESYGSSGDDTAHNKHAVPTPSPKASLSPHGTPTDKRAAPGPAPLSPAQSSGSKSPSSPDSTRSCGSLGAHRSPAYRSPARRRPSGRSGSSGGRSQLPGGRSRRSASSRTSDTQTRSSISTRSSLAKFTPLDIVPTTEGSNENGSEERPAWVGLDPRLHPQSAAAAAKPALPAQYSPAALSLKMASELNLLETLEESVRQLSELERTRHVSLAQQESVSLARVLQARQRDHEREIQLLSLKARQEVEEANKQLEAVRQRAVETASDAERVLAQARRETADAVGDSARRLMESQAEAARVTAEAAKQMAEAHRNPPQPPTPSYDPGKLASDTATAATAAAVTAALEQQRLQQLELLREMRGARAPPSAAAAVHTRSLGVGDQKAQPSQASYSSSSTSSGTRSSGSRSDDPRSPKQDYTDDFTDSRRTTTSISTGTIPDASSPSPVSGCPRPRIPKSPAASESVRTASDVSTNQELSGSPVATESGFSPVRTEFSPPSRRSISSIKTSSDVDAARSPSISEDIPGDKPSYYSSPSESRTKTSSGPTPSSASTPIRGKEAPIFDIRQSATGNLAVPDDSFRLSAELLRQQLRDEEVRSQQQGALFKLRERTLVEKAKVELEWLEHEKRGHKDSGDAEKLQTVRKKQQALVVKVQQEQAEIRRLRAAQKAASQERQLLLYQQQEILHMRRATEAVKDHMKDLSSVSITSSLGGALRVDHSASPPSPSSSPELPGVLSDSTAAPDSPTGSSGGGGGGKKAWAGEGAGPGAGPGEETEGGATGQMTAAEKQSHVMLTLKKMQQPLSMKYLSKREQQLTRRRRNAEELLAWQHRLDEEESQIVDMERKAMRRLDSGIAKPRPPMKALPPPTGLGDDAVPASDAATDADGSPRGEGPRDGGGRAASSSSVPEDISHDSSVPEEVISEGSPNISTTRTASAINTDDTLQHTDSVPEDYASESFELAGEHTLTPLRPPATAPLAPRSQHSGSPRSSLESLRAPLSPHRRILESESGSESEKSFSQTVSEIASDQSDIEGRVKALESELRKRKTEADKLRRQQKRMQREKLKAQEASLKKQLESYDKLIEKTKAELKNESEAAAKTTSVAVKPQIKQLRMSEAQRLRDRSHARSLRQRTASDSSREGGAELGAARKQRSVSEGSLSSRSSFDEEAGSGRDHAYTSLGSVFTQPTTPRLVEDITPPPPKSLSPSPSAKHDRSSLSADISEEVFDRTSSSTSDEDSQRAVNAGQSPEGSSSQKQGPQQAEDLGDTSAVSEVSEDIPLAYSSSSATPDVSQKESPRSDVERDNRVLSPIGKAPTDAEVTVWDVRGHRSEHSEASDVPEEVLSAASYVSQDSVKSVSKKVVLDGTKYPPETDHLTTPEMLERRTSPQVSLHSHDELSQKSEKSHSYSSSVRSSRRSRTQSEQSGASYSDEFFDSSVSLGLRNKEGHSEDTDDDISEVLSVASEPSEPSVASSGKLGFNWSTAKAAEDDREPAPEVTISERDVTEEHNAEAVGEEDDTTPVASPDQLEISQDFTGYRIGDRVVVSGQHTGSLLFKGLTHFAPGLWGGVALDGPNGTNDGSLDGHIYFRCTPWHGTFVPADRLEHFTPKPRRAETEQEQDSSVKEEIPSAASEVSDASDRKRIQALKDKEEDKLERSLLSSLSSKTPSESMKPLAQVLKSEATDDDSVVEDLSEPMTDDAALAALISSAAAAVESFHEDDLDQIFPPAGDAETPRGAPEPEVTSLMRSKDQLVDSITDHLTAVVVGDSVMAIAEAAEKQTSLDGSTSRITSTEKPTSSLLELLVHDEAVTSPRDDAKGQEVGKAEEKENRKVEIKRKLESTTQTLLDDAITEMMSLRSKRAKRDSHESITIGTDENKPENLRTKLMSDSPKSPSPETPCPSPFVRNATPYTPDSESPVQLEDATLDDDIFINRVKVETNSEDLKDQDQLPLARPGSPVFGESSGFNPEALSERLEQMQQLGQDIFEGDLFGEQEWFDDDFGSMPKSKSIIQVPVRNQEAPTPAPPSTGTPEPSRLDLARIAQEPFYAVPHNRNDVKSLVGKSVRVFHEKVAQGERTGFLSPPGDIMGEDTQGSDIESTSRKSYKRLVFDLVGEAYQDITTEQEQSEQLPWTKTKRRPRKYFFDRPPRELPDIAQVVEDRALFVAGLTGRPKLDPVLNRYGKKKKDHVDEILTLELREEEQEWVNYDDDELAVKMQLTEAIFDSLLMDTAVALNRIQDKRRARRGPPEPEIEF